MILNSDVDWKRKQDIALNDCESCSSYCLHSLFPLGIFLSFDYEKRNPQPHFKTKRAAKWHLLAQYNAIDTVLYCLHTKSEKKLRCLKKTDTGNEERKYTSGKNEVARHCVVGIGSIVAAAYYRIR